jgi:ABC-type amino acid transport/signal transduction systems, periplasmic component/domain
MLRRIGVVLLGLLATLALAACGLTVPSDPEGTLDRVRDDGVLRVGATHAPPWVVTSDGDEPTGDEPALVEEFAARQGAVVEWRIGGEESLVAALERGELDLVIGGFTDATPWTDRAATTVPYTEAPGPDGAPQKHVMLARMGENRFLVELEEFLLESGEAP